MINLNKKILIVDDSLVVANILKFRVESLGYETDIASDGLEALKMIKESEYVLVFLDLMLPKLGGIEVAKKLRSEEYNKYDLPIVAISANDSLDFANSGINSFVKKPFDLNDVENVIELLV